MKMAVLYIEKDTSGEGPTVVEATKETMLLNLKH